MNDNVIVIADVSSSYFSVARYSGGIKYNGTVYIYCRERDILVRDSLSEIAELNITKIAGRVERGTIHGVGDNR